jgi:pyridoxal 5'-phosphate synthase pdxS subunit
LDPDGHNSSADDSTDRNSGSGIFKSDNPAALAKAIVLATTHFDDPAILAEVSTGLGAGMKGEGNLGKAAGKEMTADRGY